MFEPDPYLIGVAAEAVSKNIPDGARLSYETCMTGDQFIDTDEKRREIVDTFREYGPVTCEMEGGAIGQVCQLYGTKYVEIRVISDGEEEDYEKFMHEAALRCARTAVDFTGLVWSRSPRTRGRTPRRARRGPHLWKRLPQRGQMHTPDGGPAGTIDPQSGHSKASSDEPSEWTILVSSPPKTAPHLGQASASSGTSEPQLVQRK